MINETCPNPNSAERIEYDDHFLKHRVTKRGTRKKTIYDLLKMQTLLHKAYENNLKWLDVNIHIVTNVK